MAEKWLRLLGANQVTQGISIVIRCEVIGNARLYLGDCREVLRSLSPVDSVVTDPPYGLQFMGKRWDYDVPSVETWAECLRVLKPGGHLLAFAGTRTQHRMAVRIEDAGFEIRDLIAWVYGSGFPKSHNLGKCSSLCAEGEPCSITADGKCDAEKEKAWQGWGTALKPALEPVTVARKPLAGTVAENVTTHGTGALNIDGCRVPGEVPIFTKSGEASDNCYGYGLNGSARTGGTTMAGRWPANLIHDGSEEVVALFPGVTGATSRTDTVSKGMFHGGDAGTVYDDGGNISAARFFYCAKASREDRNEGCEAMQEKPLLWSSGTQNPGSFQAEGTKRAAKNSHPTVKPTDLMRYLCRLVTPPGGVVLDPFMGSGSTGRAAVLEGFQFIGIEVEPAYFDIACARIAAVQEQLRLFA